MKTLRGTYVHRGDRTRRSRRLKQLFLAGSFFSATAFLLGNREPATRSALAATTNTSNAFRIDLSTNRSLTGQLDSARGELALAHIQLEHAQSVIGYSAHYAIGADLAGTILDVAQAEGIDPELAFRLVKLESDFNAHATSPVGAVGLTQVMPSTARFYHKGMSARELYDPATNLHVGFQYLRGLVTEYHGNMNLALLVYNRGPAAVAKAKANGDDPSNGYERILMKGYKGRGIIN